MTPFSIWNDNGIPSERKAEIVKKQKDAVEKIMSAHPKLDKKLRDLIKEKVRQREALWEEIIDLMRPHLPNNPMFLEYDFWWGCPKSPFGWCVYDPYTDPGANDDCLFCHEPQERK